MTTRRDFLGRAGSLAGVVFCGCGLPAAARAEKPAARLPVMVKGKRIKTIDVHGHCYFQQALDAAGLKVENVIAPVKGIPDHFIVVEERLKLMDEKALDMQFMSTNPFWYGLERDKAEATCKINNEKMAELIAMKPDRFGGYAALALQFPDLAVTQLEHAVNKLGLRGAAIGGSVAGEDFSSRRFHPIWAKAEELGVVLFIHPATQPQLAQRYKGNGWLSNTIGNPLDTTIALQHLIFEGTLDKYPGLKVLAAHGGGFLPSYAMRGDHSCFVSPPNCDPSIVLKKKPSEYLNQLYFDSIVFSAEALRHLVAQVGASQIVIGTDSPIPWEMHPIDHVMGAPISDKEKAEILGLNAAKLFGIKTA